MSKGNHDATGKKSKHGSELVQRVRAAILNTFDAVEKEGKLISEILAEEMKANPLKFLEMASRFCPREVAMEVEANITHHTEEMSEVDLEYIAAGGSNRAAKKASKQKEPTPVH